MADVIKSGGVSDSGADILKGFGKQVRVLRQRAGMSREMLGREIGYGPDLVTSVELGRRVAQPHFINAADDVLEGGGILKAVAEEVANARYPAWFRDVARLEEQVAEYHSYTTLVVSGLLQTEDYARALFTMRRPLLDQDTIEQRVSARMARQAIFTRWPAPIMSFVIEMAALQRPLGGKSVLQGQLQQLLKIGQMRNVEIQVMPTEREDHAGVDGPFALLTPQGRPPLAYQEGQGRSSLITCEQEVRTISSRYGIIRAQALTPDESLRTIDKLLGDT